MSGNENLCAAAGVEPAMRLADAAGLDRLVAGHAGLAGPQAASTPLKVGCLVTGMLMGADSIDDMNVLRDCGLHHVLAEVRAPSTPGSFLRAFHHGNVRQLNAVHRRLLAGLAARAPLLPGKDVLACLDIDACQRRVCGVTKQGAAFGATKIQGKVVTVRGLNLLASSLSTRTGAPLMSGVRLHGGSANCTRGAASFLREQIGTARDAGVTGDLIVWMDSSYYNGKAIKACRDLGACFSVTMRHDPKRLAIGSSKITNSGLGPERRGAGSRPAACRISRQWTAPRRFRATPAHPGSGDGPRVDSPAPDAARAA